MQDLSEILGDTILKPKEVAKAVGLSLSSIYRLSKAGKFPKRVQLSEHRSGFWASDIKQWLDERKGQ